MTVVRRLARPMLASMFVTDGLDALRHPGGRAQAAAPFLESVAQPLGLPNDPELLVRVNGAAMLGAGAMLGLGRMPRLSALVLAVTMVPTTYVGHAFWGVEDREARVAQRTQFLKNLSMIGGLLVAAVDTEGKPGVAWRARRAAELGKKDAHRAAKSARREAKALRREAKLAGANARHALT